MNEEYYLSFVFLNNVGLKVIAVMMMRADCRFVAIWTTQ